MAGRRARPWLRRAGRPVRHHRARRDRDPALVRRAKRTVTIATRRARLAADRPARLRDARARAASCPRRSTPARLARAARAGRRARLRPAGRLRRPRAQREPGLADRLRSALRGGRRSSSGRTASRSILVGNECYGMAGAAPLPMRRELFQDLSLPGQPRDRSRPLADDPRRGGDRAGEPRRGHRLEDVRRAATSIDAPSFIVDELRAADRAGRPGRERDRPAHRRGGRAAGRSTRSSSWRCSSTPPARPRTGSAGC